MINEKIIAQLDGKPITARRIHARLPDGVVSLATVVRVLNALIVEGDAVRRKQGEHWFYAKTHDAFAPAVPISFARQGPKRKSKTWVKQTPAQTPMLEVLDAHPWSTLGEIVALTYHGSPTQRRRAENRINKTLVRMAVSRLVSRYVDGGQYRYARRGTMIPCGWQVGAA